MEIVDAATAALPGDHSGSRMKILLLDDDPMALQVLSIQLRNLGYQSLVVCEHAEDALELLAKDADSIDLVFCDLQMPGMDGVEFVRKLASVRAPPPLVFVSGEDQRLLESVQRLARAHRLEVLGTLHKPVPVERLRGVLETHHAYTREMTVTGLRAIYPPEDLHRAIKGGELVNHYQPKIDLQTCSVVGVETLVRWRHPKDGLVFPDRFIPLAEESGLIDELTHAVLVAALAQSRSWRDTGRELGVAVNISMNNLEQLDFPDVVAAAITAMDLPPQSLVLEVTESQLMRDVRIPLDILTRLRLRRIDLSIDDFGTGHSSLAQLRDLPFNELKLDRGFVHGATTDRSLRALVENSLRLAGQLEMRTVAEGVETRADWDFLAAAGCNLAQGYFIARPMLAEHLPEWMSQWEQRRPELIRAVS
jgi:EAL domain-containing protein (putative c-di-GMP-specific phosphodiesterase class I)/DNA-binding NarL/FixJ family response regulator